MDRQLLEYIVMIHGNQALDCTKLCTSQIATECDKIESIIDQLDQRLGLMKRMQ